MLSQMTLGSENFRIPANYTVEEFLQKQVLHK